MTGPGSPREVRFPALADIAPLSQYDLFVRGVGGLIRVAVSWVRITVGLATLALVTTAQARTLHVAAETASSQPLTIYGVLDPPQVRPLLADFAC